MPKPFKFELGQTVAIAVSGEAGAVIGRAEYVHAEHSYLIRYADADFRAVEAWWTESALVAAGDGKVVEEIRGGEA